MKLSSKFILILIIIIAIFFRFNNLNWDNNHHLHPDERFLTMVGNAMRIPTGFSDYLDPKTSLMNPTNVNFKFFVYGVFPLILNKILAVFLNNDNYDMFTIQGRFLSALFDLLVVILVYKTTVLLVETSRREVSTKKIALWAAFFYAIAVLPIQLSHYFAVDTFLNFFMFGSFYYILKIHYSSSEAKQSREVNKDSSRPARTIKWLFLSAIFFGLALSTKIIAFFILPLNILFLTLTNLKRSHQIGQLFKIFLPPFFYLLLSYFALRIADPYVFANSNLLDPRPSALFIQNIKELKSFEGKDIWYPPGIQWISKNPTFPLINIAFFGVGIPYFILIVTGIIYILRAESRRKLFKNSSRQSSNNNWLILLLLFWVIGFFIYQSFQFVKVMRYFIFIYPFLAIFAGIGASRVISILSERSESKGRNLAKRIGFAIQVLLVLLLLIWPVMFSSIYRNKHSRIAASEWIYENIEDKAIIANEHWDDGLPLPMVNTYGGKQFITLEFPVFAPDNEEKWNQMDDILHKADYYILSSNRGWGSITTVSEKYPRMSKFYDDLFNGKTQFQKIREFTSYPKLCLAFSGKCLVFEDDWADESFTVYDHPKVIIFKKTNVVE